MRNRTSYIYLCVSLLLMVSVSHLSWAQNETDSMAPAQNTNPGPHEIFVEDRATFDALPADLREELRGSFRLWLNYHRPRTLDELKRILSHRPTAETFYTERALLNAPMLPMSEPNSPPEETRRLPRLRTSIGQRHITIFSGERMTRRNHLLARALNVHPVVLDAGDPFPYISYEIIDTNDVRDEQHFATLLRAASLSSDLIVFNAHSSPTGAGIQLARRNKPPLWISADFFSSQQFDLTDTVLLFSGCETAATTWPADFPPHYRGRSIGRRHRLLESVMNNTHAAAAIGMTTEANLGHLRELLHLIGIYGGGMTIGEGLELGYESLARVRFLTRDEFGAPKHAPKPYVWETPRWADGSPMLPATIHEAWNDYQEMLFRDPTLEAPFWWYMASGGQHLDDWLTTLDPGNGLFITLLAGSTPQTQAHINLLFPLEQRLRELFPEFMRANFSSEFDFFIFAMVCIVAESVHNYLNQRADTYLEAIQLGYWSQRTVNSFRVVGYDFSERGIRVPLFPEYSARYPGLAQGVGLQGETSGVPALIIELGFGSYAHDLALVDGAPKPEQGPLNLPTRVSPRIFSADEIGDFFASGILPHGFRPHPEFNAVFHDSLHAIGLTLDVGYGESIFLGFQDLPPPALRAEDFEERVEWAYEGATAVRTGAESILALWPMERSRLRALYTEVSNPETTEHESAREPNDTKRFVLNLCRALHEKLPRLILPLGGGVNEVVTIFRTRQLTTDEAFTMPGPSRQLRRLWNRLHVLIGQATADIESVTTTDLLRAYTNMLDYLTRVASNQSQHFVNSALRASLVPGSAYDRLHQIEGANFLWEPDWSQPSLAMDPETAAVNQAQLTADTLSVLSGYREAVAVLSATDELAERHWRDLGILMRALQNQPGGAMPADITTNEIVVPDLPITNALVGQSHGRQVLITPPTFISPTDNLNLPRSPVIASRASITQAIEYASSQAKLAGRQVPAARVVIEQMRTLRLAN